MSRTRWRAVTERRIGGLVGVSALLAITACIPVAAPPPRDVITSVAVSSGVAGQLTTISVRVSDDAAGDSPVVVLDEGAGPAGARIPGSGAPDACRFGWWPAQATQISGGSELTITCRLPETMVNGSWSIGVSAIGSFGSSYEVPLPLVVTGGTDDLAPPVVTILSPPSQVVPRGGSFTIAYRIEDDHPTPQSGLYPSWFQLQGNKPYDTTFFCEGPDDQFLLNQVSPTVIEVSFDCKVPAVLEPGPYQAWPQAAGDIYGRATEIAPTVTIT